MAADRPGRYKLMLQNRTDACEHLYGFLQQSLQGGVVHAVDDETVNDLKLVSEEWMANVMQHGYGSGVSGTLEIELAVEKDCIRVIFKDDAAAFNPLESGPEASRDPSTGGMGLTIIRSLSDDLHYARENGHNVFTVTKHYNPV